MRKSYANMKLSSLKTKPKPSKQNKTKQNRTECFYCSEQRMAEGNYLFSQVFTQTQNINVN